MKITVLVVPIEGHDVMFIPHAELLELGYSSLEDFLIVEANDRFFELQGFDNKTELWWVEEIKLTEEDDSGQGLEGVGERGVEGPGGDT